jgi:hypothetical protein
MIDFLQRDFPEALPIQRSQVELAAQAGGAKNWPLSSPERISGDSHKRAAAAHGPAAANKAAAESAEKAISDN